MWDEGARPPLGVRDNPPGEFRNSVISNTGYARRSHTGSRRECSPNRGWILGTAAQPKARDGFLGCNRSQGLLQRIPAACPFHQVFRHARHALSVAKISAHGLEQHALVATPAPVAALGQVGGLVAFGLPAIRTEAGAVDANAGPQRFASSDRVGGFYRQRFILERQRGLFRRRLIDGGTPRASQAGQHTRRQ